MVKHKGMNLLHINKITMGIDLLLRLLKPSLPQTHLCTLSHKTAAIDALSWLYKSLCQSPLPHLLSHPTTCHLSHLFLYLHLLAHYQITPIMVFDGRLLDLKRRTV